MGTPATETVDKESVVSCTIRAWAAPLRDWIVLEQRQDWHGVVVEIGPYELRGLGSYEANSGSLLAAVMPWWPHRTGGRIPAQPGTDTLAVTIGTYLDGHVGIHWPPSM